MANRRYGSATGQTGHEVWGKIMRGGEQGDVTATRSVLITQCLQQDFVDPIGPYEPLPNQLHVGHTEAVRLLGDDPSAGPLAQLMDWAQTLPPDGIEIVHIRDWHDPEDPAQRDHLATFGAHCLRDSPGARLVLGLDEMVASQPNQHLVDSLTLNDFEGTDLELVLGPLVEESAGNLKVGVIGVWTEAKVSFLLYELKTRLGIDRLATCSALTASESRAQHFIALDQLERILGVRCFDSVAEFAAWLHPEAQLRLPAVKRGAEPRIDVAGADSIDAADRAIVAYLFRESSSLRLTPLGGGFSGASVFRTESSDTYGHSQAPAVVKIGPNGAIAQERVAFERVEEVLGNNAPRVRGFVDLGGRAGIKYSYAAMGKSDVRTLKQLFEVGESTEVLEDVLRRAFGEVLEPLYAASRYERLPILAAYEFSAMWAPDVRRNVGELVPGADLGAATVDLPGGVTVPNVCRFYDDFLATERLPTSESHYVSFVHGDLNASNILMDDQRNVWVIDFFHTGRGHVLKDLAKIENDLLYILTPVRDAAELAQAVELTRELCAVTDLQAPLPEPPPVSGSRELTRAWRLLRLLRDVGGRLCREDRHPLQLHVALLRYAVHTLQFDESSELQRCWALAAAGILSEQVAGTIRADRALRIDWLPDANAGNPGRLGITICPGRRDRGRELDDDLRTLRDAGVSRLLCLLPDTELSWAGVGDLPERARALGLDYLRYPVPDQAVPGLDAARDLVAWCHAAVDAGERVVVCCMGGLGRSGTVAACYLVEQGMDAPHAIAAVRRARDPRVVENRTQEEFVASYAASRPA